MNSGYGKIYAYICIRIDDDSMSKQIMLSDEAYSLLAKRKGKGSFSELIVALVNETTPSQKSLKNLLKIRPWDWGENSKNSSNEIDEVLYGGNL